jgi:hypothetical protein
MKSGTALMVALLLPIPIGAAQAVPDAAVTSARLEVKGSPGCVTRDDLVARVEARSPRIRFVDDAALSAQVSFDTPRPGTVIADLVLATVDAKRTPRRVVARSCAEAADAVALIITVTLDPTIAKKPATDLVRAKNVAREREAAAGPEADAARSAPSEPPSASVSQPMARPAEQLRLPKETDPPVTVESAETSSPPSPVIARRRFGAYLAAQSAFGPAPTVMPGVALYVLAALDRDSPWSPAVQVGATHVWRSDLSEPGGKASFALDAASLDLCVLRLRLPSIETRACGAALVGLMTASGAADTDAPGSSTRPFAVAGGAILVTVGVGAIVELSARLGMGATLIRDSYELAPPAFHRADAVTTSASLGIGARWP